MKMFGIRTVDDALASLSKGLVQLNTLQDALRDSAHQDDAQIAALQTSRDDKLAEASRAQRVSEKLADLLA